MDTGPVPRVRIHVALAIAATLAGCARETTSAPADLDTSGWQDPQNAQARFALADRLLADRALIGRTRAEVVALLGEPPPTGYFREWDLVYHLGPERTWMSIDSEWLVLRLAADGRVTDARLVRD